MIRLRLAAASCLVSAILLVPQPVPAATNDPLSSRLWGLQRIGAERAWSVSRGEGVIIAIVDTGVKLSHPDLKDKLLPGLNLARPGAPADDEHGHGTLIAGVSAAATNNGIGMASVAPDAKVLPLRVFNAQGIATSGQVTRAIRWAVQTAEQRRSKLVLNLSFVGPPRPPDATGRSGTLLGDRAVRRAITEATDAGAVVVAASGNEGLPQTSFDAPPDRGILVVGAADKQDRCAPFTNYGAGLDLLAPGVDILSTYWNRTPDQSVYAFADGSSLAVPFAAGTAALLMSTGLTNVEAVNRILGTARGPAVSCRGEATSYKHLDVAAALGVPRPEGELSVSSGEKPSFLVPDSTTPEAGRPSSAGQGADPPTNSRGRRTGPAVAAERAAKLAEDNPFLTAGLAVVVVAITLMFVLAFRRRASRQTDSDPGTPPG
jgi:subtilisin family serine protease